MKAVFLLLARVALGAVFLYAAVGKLGDMRLFAEEIANYHLVPAAMVPLIAASVVGTELFTGLLLVAGFRARAAALVISLLLIVFIGALSQALLREIDLRCGCFGTAEAASWGTVARDGWLLLASATLARLGPGRFSIDRS